MAEVTLHSAFNTSLFNCSPVSKTSKGGKIVYLIYNNTSRLKLQTPVMSAPFGVSRYDDANNGSSFSLDASFKGLDTNAKLANFLVKCREFDEWMLDAATQHSKAWFGKEMGRELVTEFYRKLVREPNDPKYAPTIRLKLTPNTEIYDEHQNRVDMNYLVKGCTFRAIVEPGSVWFVGKNFGVSFRIVQVAVISRPDGIAGFAFKTEEDEDAVDTNAFLD